MEGQSKRAATVISSSNVLMNSKGYARQEMVLHLLPKEACILQRTPSSRKTHSPVRLSAFK